MVAGDEAQCSSDRPDLDFPVPDAGLVGGLGGRGWAAHDAAVGELEGAGVPRADDATVDELSLIKWAAGVSAGVGQGGYLAVGAGE